VNLTQLTDGLRAIAAADPDVGFAEKARRSGLDPRRDFRQANMTGADLRGQDLRGFDFRHANFGGAKLNQRQRASAERQGRAVAMFVGRQLEAAHGEFQAALTRSVVTPPVLNAALRSVGREREQHYGAGGTFLSDGRRAVSRLMGNAFRQTETAIKDSMVAVIFFEPTTDFDFDTLDVLHRRIERLGRRHFTFVFPSFMEGESGRRLFAVRAKTAFTRPQDTVIFDRGSDRPAALKAAQDTNIRYLQFVVEWLNVLEASRIVRPHASGYTAPDALATFVSGILPRGASLVQTLKAALPTADPATGGACNRRHLFLAEDVLPDIDLDAAIGVLAKDYIEAPVAVSTYRRPASMHAGSSRFFLLAAPGGSAAWPLVYGR
jgi:hypothetical protein